MKHKQLFSFFIMLLLIILALPIGMYTSLNSIRVNAEQDYYNDQTGYAISQGIQSREDAARNLIKIAKKYQDQYTELQNPMTELEQAISLLEDSSLFSVTEKNAEANRNLNAPAQALAEMLKNLDISESDINSVNNQLTELSVAQEEINRSNYNTEAAAFNQKLEKYPAKLMNNLGIIQSLPDYRSS